MTQAAAIFEGNVTVIVDGCRPRSTRCFDASTNPRRRSRLTPDTKAVLRGGFFFVGGNYNNYTIGMSGYYNCNVLAYNILQVDYNNYNNYNNNIYNNMGFSLSS